MLMSAAPAEKSKKPCTKSRKPCDCWYCLEKIDNDDLADDGSSTHEFEADVEYVEYHIQ
jgi:hypothetical protein